MQNAKKKFWQKYNIIIQDSKAHKLYYPLFFCPKNCPPLKFWWANGGRWAEKFPIYNKKAPLDTKSRGAILFDKRRIYVV